MRSKNADFGQITKDSLGTRIAKDFKRNYSLYLLVIPVLLFYGYFHYKPMYGILMAFQKFNIRRGISGSEWIGFENFIRFFNDPYFTRNIVNTFTISATSIIFGFPAPIIFALLINEISKKWFAKTVQTITYMPHFISLVVLCGMIRNFVATDGIVTSIVNMFTANPATESLLNNKDAFVPIYVVSGIWQEIGWGSIIYLAALAGVDAELYEAARIDGAGRFRQTISITIPSILPTIITLGILKLGGILSVGYEKILLLHNPFNAETSEVLSYYIYQKSLASQSGPDYGLSTAAGLFNSVINLFFIVTTNKISKKLNGTSLW